MSASTKTLEQLLRETDELRRRLEESTSLLQAERRAREKAECDMEERKRLEAELRRRVEEMTRADRRKDEFLALLAHELRNPLVPIRNAAQILKLLAPPDPPLRQAREMIDRQVGYMARLIDELLDVSRIARGKILLRKERLDLAALVLATLRDHQSALEANGLALELHLPASPLWMTGDPTRLAQILSNVLHNANKYTDTGGRITVRMETEGQSVAVLRVHDTGIGMSPETLACLFESYSQADRSLTRSRGGLGLGLALVKGLVELHGGSVSAASDGLGHGSEFTIRFPLEGEAAPPKTPSGTLPKRSCRILVIDDNRDETQSMKMLLELVGHRVAAAHSGSEGLTLAYEFQPEVVLCQLDLPGATDGCAVAHALRHDPALQSAYLIALVGYGHEEEEQRLQEAGFDLHLTKPINFAELQTVLGSSSPPC
jgi:signal transduction histidine kinase